jgi:hypothetical protein
VATVLTWTAAFLSLGLVLGLSVWGYRMAVREVAGVPVIRAPEGEARRVPTDPGGRQVAHQGLAVNRIAAEGAAAPPPDRIVLAPRPLDIVEGDQPVVLAALALPAAPELPLPAEEGTVTDALEPDEGEDAAGSAIAAALAEALSEAPAEAPPVAAGEPAFVPPPGALVRSVRPMPRPGGAGVPAAARAVGPGAAGDDAAVRSALAGAMASLGPRGPREIDPAAIRVGTRLVQLGTYDDEAAARAAWDAIAARFGALMDGRDRVLQTAESGGRSFVRLRVHGFADEAEARQFCAALLAEEASCIPVLVR